MTCIVGMVNKTSHLVTISGDSVGVDDGFGAQSRADQKVFVNAGFAFGFTSSYRMGQLLRYKFVPPARKVGQDLMEYMVVSFVDEIRSVLRAGGFLREEHNVETGGAFLVGHEGRLFRIETDFQVAEPRLCYDAVGCGTQLALGSIWTSINGHVGLRRESVPDILETALKAATEFSGGVRPPYHSVTV